MSLNIPKNPTPQQIDAIEDLRKFMEKIDEMIMLDLELDKWLLEYRENAYLGGTHGITNDAKYNIDDVKNAQRLIDNLKVIGFLEGELLSPSREYSGKYSKRMYAEVLGLQKKINEYLKENKLSVVVPPSRSEINILKTIVKEYNLYNLDLDKPLKWKSPTTDLSYEVNVTSAKINEDRIGHIKVYDKNGELLKKISFRVGRDGKATLSGTVLYKILEDGYLGIETRRAISLTLQHALSKEEEELTPQQILPTEEKLNEIVPEKTDKVVEVYIQPIALTASDEFLDDAIRRLRVVDKGELSNKKNRDKVREKLKYILDVYKSLPPDLQNELWEKPGELEINGKSYSLTIEGMMKAKIEDGVDYITFLDKWQEKLKEQGLLKYKNENINKGKVPLFVGDAHDGGPTNTSEVSDGSPTNTKFGVSTEDIERKFDVMIRNVESYLSGNGPWKERLIKFLQDEKKWVNERIKEIAKSSSSEEDFFKKLNEDEELYKRVELAFAVFGHVPSSAIMFEVDAIKINLTSLSAIREYIEEVVKQNSIGLSKINEITDKFMKYIYKDREGRYYIKLGEITDPKMKAFALNLYLHIQQEEYKKEKKKMARHVKGEIPIMKNLT